MANEASRIPYDQVVHKLQTILQTCGMNEDRAERCAQLFTDASRDGVPSHGLNRFASVAKAVREGKIAANVEMQLVEKFGIVERWDGMLGPGVWNAWTSMNRAVEIARNSGMGCVALARTNHWMRAGNYGWQAADAGCIGICWTNTWPLMAPWGGKQKKLGNNPLVIAVPRNNGEHVVLDMAMSQYSMGKLGIFQKQGVQSPTPAGFDRDGKMTSDPGAVIDGGSAMPIGFWKGTGLALMLDLVASVLSGGLPSTDLGKERWEHKVSQVFIAIDVRRMGGEAVGEKVIGALKEDEANVLYPGERSMRTRRESMQRGVEVDPEVWDAILRL